MILNNSLKQKLRVFKSENATTVNYTAARRNLQNGRRNHYVRQVGIPRLKNQSKSMPHCATLRKSRTLRNIARSILDFYHIVPLFYHRINSMLHTESFLCTLHAGCLPLTRQIQTYRRAPELGFNFLVTVYSSTMSQKNEESTMTPEERAAYEKYHSWEHFLELHKSQFENMGLPKYLWRVCHFPTC